MATKLLKICIIILAAIICINAAVINIKGHKLCGSELTRTINILCRGSTPNTINSDLKIPAEVIDACCTSSCSSLTLLSFCPSFDEP